MKKTLLAFLTLTLVIVLTACNNKGITFVLLSDNSPTYKVNLEYTEQGFIAKDGTTDLSDYVTISNNIDTTSSGDYTVTYTLDYKNVNEVLTRKIYYREDGCEVIKDTNTTVCTTQWSEYLSTYVSLKIYYDNDTYNDQSQAIFNNVENIISNFHELSNKYDAFNNVVNVKTINSTPTATHTIDQDLFDLISFTLEHQDEVDNRFNMALGPVLSLWHDAREMCNSGFNVTCELPLLEDLQDANQYTDQTKIILDPENLTITMDENMSIDLGGVSKGYISDKIVEYLDALNLSGYLLNNGTSNISIGGNHPTRENDKFLLAITDPTNPFGGYYATAYLSDGDQMVTSGDYQQYFTFEDEIYHHIINPTTLMPERTSHSVSIITQESAGLADLYSTAIFTMTVEDGITFVNSIQGLEAIWYGNDGKVYFSENFEDLYLDQLYN